MTGTLATHDIDESSIQTDREFVEANIAKMVAATGDPSAVELDRVAEDDADERLAASSFDAWVHEEGEWTPPTNEEWVDLINPHLVVIRIAWFSLYKTKPELIEVATKMHASTEGDGRDMLFSTLDRLHDTSNMLKGMLSIVESATARLLVAGMNVPDQGEVGEANPA